MNILLCQDLHETTARPMTPVGLLDLAAYYRQLGHSVLSKPVNKVAGGHYDIIGLSAMSPSPEALLANLKRLRPMCDRLVLGGKVTHRLRDEERRAVECLADIHDGPGETLFGGGYSLEGYPSWRPEDVASMGIRDGTLMSSRGCPYHCNFCHNTEDKVRRFSPQRTVANMLTLRHLGARVFHFVDDVFGLSAGHGRGILDEAKRHEWDIRGMVRFFIHVRHVSSAIELIRMFQPVYASIGIESGCDATLSAMNKGFSAQEALDAVRTIHEATRANLYAMWMLGYPGEGRGGIEQSIRLAGLMSPYVVRHHVSLYQPVVGTMGYDMAMQRNPKMRDACGNDKIAWLDPLLKPQDLLSAKQEILAFNRNPATILDHFP